jgi:hypothetical protein
MPNGGRRVWGDLPSRKLFVEPAIRQHPAVKPARHQNPPAAGQSDPHTRGERNRCSAGLFIFDLWLTNNPSLYKTGIDRTTPQLATPSIIGGDRQTICLCKTPPPANRCFVADQ